MMNVHIIAYILIFVAAVCHAVPLECNLIGPKSPTLRLKRHLFCEYDTTIRPVANKATAINVTVGISPKFMEFIDSSSTFIIHSWVYISWKDEHLTWNKDDFDGVSRLQIKSDDIWVPDFSIYNSGDMGRIQTGVKNTICQLLYTGSIHCMPAVKYSTQCETDYTYWPYDTQTCSIRMGSWTHTGEEINFNFRRKSINMVNFIPHKEWQVTNYTTKKYSPKYSCCPNDTFPTLIVNFDLQRHSPMINAVFITPAIVLMVITLTALWLDSRSVERISLAAVNFICHLLCICDLHWVLPSNASSPPQILLFYRDSMILASFAMVITCFLRKLQSASMPAPSWIVSTVSFVATNRAGKFFFLENSSAAKQFVNSTDVEENNADSDSNVLSKHQHDDTWRKLAVIFDWFSFIVALIIYILLIVVSLPKANYKSELDDSTA